MTAFRMLFASIILALALNTGSAFAGKASSFAGSPTSAQFPPPGVTVTETDTWFPNPAQVGFAGPTPTGDEAAAVQTAPQAIKVKSIFPVLKANASDSHKFDVTKHWGHLSPFTSVSSHGLPHASQQIPSGCELKQVFLLHRHGARYPTSSGSTFAEKLHAVANSTGFTAKGPLSFLNTWTYKLGAGILTPFGRDELFNLGVGFRVKYGHLLKQFEDLPVWRTTSQGRMVDSALHFAAGFFGVQSYMQSYHQVFEIEQDHFNSTLNSAAVCPNANNKIGLRGRALAAEWGAKYATSTAKRLNKHLEGVTLDASNVIAMQSLCAYESVALGYSAFCDLFTVEEWKNFAYYLDIMFWYSFGPGNPTNAALGVGWVQELVSRLTQTRITKFDTSVNSTIVSSNVTFPLYQPIFVDASHDTTITAILTAMNFTSFAEAGDLPLDHIPDYQTYHVRKLVPFAANLVGQVMSCPSSSSTQSIRWILNDAVVPLTGIKGCKPNAHGLCDLQTFTKAMEQRIEEIDFQHDCFADYDVPGTVNASSIEA